MTPGRWTPVALLRHHVFRVSAIAAVADRVGELGTGVPELNRQLPELAGVVDRLEDDVMELAAHRLAAREER